MARRSLSRGRRKRSRSKLSLIEDTVAGMFVRNGKFLVEKRRSDDDGDPGFLAIPGGHLEKGESLHQALKREMKEELGVIINKVTWACVRLHRTTNGERNRIHYFRVNAWKGRIAPHEAEKVYWESNPRNLTASSDRKAMMKILSHTKQGKHGG